MAPAVVRVLNGACSFSPMILGIDLSLLWAGGSYDAARGRELATSVQALASRRALPVPESRPCRDVDSLR